MPAASLPAELAADADNVVRLPQGVSIDDIRLDGNNLVLVQPDGSTVTILNAALKVPTFLIGDVEIPELALATALQANGIDVAAGPDGALTVVSAASQSSGGGFNTPNGDIGDAGPVIDLLPPTALQFGTLERRELFPSLDNGTPTVGKNDAALLDDDALFGGNPGGLGDDPDAVNASGRLNFDYGTDGVGSVILSGAVLPAGFTSVISGGGTVLTISQDGTPVLQVSLTDATSGNYTVTQLAPISHPTPGALEENVDFTVQYTVTDGNGDSVDGTLDINVDDDMPTLSVEPDVRSTANGLPAFEVDETENGNTSDRYNTGESEEGVNNNTDDVLGDPTILGRVQSNYTDGLAGFFNVGGSYGADGAGTLTGSFTFSGISVGSPIATNLEATDGGAISLIYVSPTQINGIDTDGDTVFTLEIVDIGGGVFQLQNTLYEAIKHDADDLFDGQEILRTQGLDDVNIQYEVTRVDSDGDPVAEAAEASLINNDFSPFVFDDDGPTAVLELTDSPTLIVDETPGAQNPDDSAPLTAISQSLGQATILASALFTDSSVYGSDGASTTVDPSFSFNIVSDDTGLTDTQSGLDVTLVDVGGVIHGVISEGTIEQETVFTLSVNGDGDVSLTQYRAVYHDANPGSIAEAYDESLTPEMLASGALELVMTITDGDGDQDSASVDLGGVIGFEDDGPSAVDDVATQGAENTAFTINAFDNDVFGADGVDVDNDPAVKVTFTQPASGVVSYDAATGLFTYTPNAGAGSDTSDSFTYTIEDGDGDVSTATVSVTLQPDSVPVVKLAESATVDEDGFAFANADAPTGLETDSTESLEDTKSITVDFGNDVPAVLDGSLVLNDTAGLDGQLVTLDGHAVEFALEGGVLVGRSAGDNSEVVRIEVLAGATASGSDVTYDYKVTLSAPVRHPVNHTEDSVTLSGVSFTATDSDGDPVPVTVDVTVVDDVPSAVDDVATQGAENTAFTINAFDNDVFGADGVDVDNDPAVKVTFTQPASGVVSYDAATGLFTYTPNAGAGSDTSDSFTYTIEDGDGDVSTATVSVTLQPDSVPVVKLAESATVDEDGFAFANADAPTGLETDSTESLEDTKSITVDFGNDVPAVLDGSLVLNDTAGLDGQLVTLDGHAVEFALEGGVLVGRSAGDNSEVVRIEVLAGATASGSDVTYDYKVTLSAPVRHPVNHTEDSVTLSGVSFTATDSDGDPVPVTVDVTVVDDVPSVSVTVSASQITVDESVGIGGSSQNEPGLAVNNDENGKTDPFGYGTLIGFATLVAAISLAGSAAGADGEQSRSVLLTNSSGAAFTGLETNLTHTETGNKIFLFTEGGIVVGREGSSSIDAATGTVVFAIEVDGEDVSLYQYGAIVHGNPSSHDDSIALDDLVYVTASITDGDGDVATTTSASAIKIAFEDDGPVIGNFTDGIIPNEVGTLNGFFDVDFGSDGFGWFEITGPVLGEVDYSYADIVDGGVTIGQKLIASSDGDVLFKLSVRMDGSYTFELVKPDAGSQELIDLTSLTSGNVQFRESSDYRVEFNAAAGHTINTSGTGFGVDNQFLSSDGSGGREYFRMEFHNPGVAGNDNPNSNPDYVDAVEFKTIDGGVAVPVDGAGTVRLHWTATNTMGTASTADDLVETDYVDVVAGVSVSALIDPSISFNVLEIKAESLGNGKEAQNRIRLNQAGIVKNILPDNESLTFEVTGFDKDGDASTQQDLNIFVKAEKSGGGYLLTGGPGDGVIAASSLADTINGGAGFDIVDYSDDTSGVSVDLSTNTLSGGDAAGDTLLGIEGIIGGSGDDALIGDGTDNYLAGGEGADTLYGGIGENTYDLTDTDNAIDKVVLDPSALTGLDPDEIIGFSSEDVVDLTELVSLSTTPGDSIGDFVRLNPGDGKELQVDADGTDGGDDWVTVATFDVQPPASITILYKDDNGSDTSGTF
ncbi:cadherin-like domain-containing protein [Nitratireductor aquibiodomus]|uniref:DUF5801 repeats-in-toxin domain-containing protein n=1 Tax=Nitratireductor aquibiodomus TaxID=204799 RepID=UPI0019D33A3B|nr:cadherin-like domain-containing protein [Nitratireductor aquibiodomus]